MQKKSKFRRILLLGLALVVAAHVVLYLPYRIEARPDLTAGPLPAASCPTGTRLSVIETAGARTLEAMAVQGGSLLKVQRMIHPAVLVRHPRGLFLFDTGLGRDIDEQFQEMPFYLQPVFGYQDHAAAVSQLEAAGIPPADIDFLVLSHLHWDHASGIEDFPGRPIRALASEIEFARSRQAAPPAFIPSQFDDPAINWQPLTLDGPAYAGFPASKDLFGDGCAVLVRLPGHTDGSLGMFLNFTAERRFLFSGDLTWTRTGVEWPAEKFVISRLLVDLHPDVIKETILRIRDLMAKHPELRLMPSHDAAAYANLPRFPEWL